MNATPREGSTKNVQVAAMSRRFSWGLLGVSVALFLVHLMAKATLVAPGIEPSALLTTAIYLPREVAIALAIAAVLSLFVESIIQQRHLLMEQLFLENMEKQRAQSDERARKTLEEFDKKARRNLLGAVFERNLPPSVVAQIETQLFTPTLYRSSAELTYFLDAAKGVDGRPKYIKWFQVTKYVIKNTTKDDAPHVIGVGVIVPRSFPDEAKIEKLVVRGQDVDISGKVSFDSDGNMLRLSWPVQLRPEEELAVEIHTRAAEALSQFELCCSGMPCEVLEINCMKPSGVDLDVVGYALHPSSPKVESHERSTRWTLRGVLPGQGLVFRWALKGPAT